MKHKKTFGRIIAVIIMVSMLSAGFSVSASGDVSSTVASMSLREKITQMLMVDFRYWDEDTTDSAGRVGVTELTPKIRAAVEKYKFGGVILFAQNLVSTEQSFHLVMDYQSAAISGGGIPMIISTDQEGGSVYRLGTGTALPGNMALGAVGNTSYSKEAGRIIGSELSSIGINTALAPVVDVNSNANNPVIGLRSFGDDPTAVGNLASALIEGLAGEGVIGCAKHFPGHGDTATDSHYGLPAVSKTYEELRACELLPYEVAISKGIDMIMAAHILYPALEKDKIRSSKTGKDEMIPATFSDDIITDLLKGKMGFSGIVTSDAMNMAAIADTWGESEAVVLAIRAGIDLVTMPTTLYNEEDLVKLDAIIAAVEDAVAEGSIPMSRIDDAVTRILTVKKEHGILDFNAKNYSIRHAQGTVGCEKNRQSERVIAAAAVTLIRNDENILPLQLDGGDRVLMLVPNENEVSQMLIGWNRARSAGNIPDGAKVDWFVYSESEISSSLKKKIDDASIVIINSEVKSASRMGYNHMSSALPNAVCEYAKSKGKTAIISSVDKPYDIQLYPSASAVLASYGCKGSDVDVTEALTGSVSSKSAYGPNIIAAIEVIFGVYDPQGKLPVNIPKFDAASKSYTDDIVYPRGYGLSYIQDDPATTDTPTTEALTTETPTTEALTTETPTTEALTTETPTTEASTAESTTADIPLTDIPTEEHTESSEDKPRGYGAILWVSAVILASVVFLTVFLYRKFK